MSVMKSEYERQFNAAIKTVTLIKTGSTGHTRPDVAINQIEHGLALSRKKLTEKGICVKYFDANHY